MGQPTNAVFERIGYKQFWAHNWTSSPARYYYAHAVRRDWFLSGFISAYILYGFVVPRTHLWVGSSCGQRTPTAARFSDVAGWTRGASVNARTLRSKFESFLRTRQTALALLGGCEVGGESRSSRGLVALQVEHQPNTRPSAEILLPSTWALRTYYRDVAFRYMLDAATSGEAVARVRVELCGDILYSRVIVLQSGEWLVIKWSLYNPSSGVGENFVDMWGGAGDGAGVLQQCLTPYKTLAATRVRGVGGDVFQGSSRSLLAGHAGRRGVGGEGSNFLGVRRARRSFFRSVLAAGMSFDSGTWF